MLIAKVVLNKRGWPYPCERIFPSLHLFSVQINIAVARGRNRNP